MFKELIPILENHEILLSLGKLKDGKIQIIVNALAEKDKDSRPVIDALRVTGTPEELDAELAPALAAYSEKSLSFDKAVAAIETDTAARLAEVKKEADKKIEEAKNKSAAAKKPVTAPKKSEPVTEPEPPSLFSQPVEPAAEATISAAPAEAPAPQAETTTETPAEGTDAPASTLLFGAEAPTASELAHGQATVSEQPIAA